MIKTINDEKREELEKELRTMIKSQKLIWRGIEEVFTPREERSDIHDCHLFPNYGEGHCDHPSHQGQSED